MVKFGWLSLSNCVSVIKLGWLSLSNCNLDEGDASKKYAGFLVLGVRLG